MRDADAMLKRGGVPSRSSGCGTMCGVQYVAGYDVADRVRVAHFQGAPLLRMLANIADSAALCRSGARAASEEQRGAARSSEER